jgi:hypothetical protein
MEKTDFLKKVWIIIIAMLFISPITEAKVWYAADSAALVTLLPQAGNSEVMSGDTIEISEGAVISAYNATSNTFLYVTNKIITIKGPDNAKIKPKIITKSGVNYVIQIPASARSGLVLENIEIDGRNVARNFVYLANATIYLPYLKIKNCYLHNVTQSGIEATGSNNTVDTCIVENSRFYYIGGTGHYAIRFNSNAVCKNFIAKNSTFQRISEGVIRIGGYQLVKKNVYIDHCTIDSITNTSNAVFNVSAGMGGSSFVFTNSIISHFFSSSNIWNRGAGFTEIVVARIKYHDIKITGSNNFLTALSSFYPDMTETDPMYADTTKGNFAINNPDFIANSSDGLSIGDTRWGASFRFFRIISPADTGKINTYNNTIILKAPAVTDLSSLVPEFTLPLGAKAYINSVEQLSGITPVNFTSPVEYQIVGKDGTVQYWKVIVNQKDLLSFNIKNFAIAGIINTPNKSVKVTLPYGTNLTALTANFTTTGDSVYIGSVKQESGVTVNDFTNPLAYTIYKNGTSENWTVNVVEDGGITAYSFISPAVTGTVNKAARSITIKVPFGTDLSNPIIAAFTHSGDSVMVGDIKQISGTTANVFNNPVSYSVYKNGVAQYWSLNVLYDVAVKSFSIRSQVSSEINKYNKTIKVVMPDYFSLTSLVARFNTHPNVNVTVNGVKQDSGITVNDFTNPVIYVFTPSVGVPESWTVYVSATGKVLSSFSVQSQWSSELNYTNKTVTSVMDFTVALTSRTATFSIPSGYVDSVGTTPQVSGTTTNNYTNPIIHHISDGYNKEDWTVTVYPWSFRYFYFAALGAMGTYDLPNKIVNVTVPYSTNITNLVATYETPGSATVTVNGATQTSGTTANNFSDTLVYVVTKTPTTQNIKVKVNKAPALSIAKLGFLTTTNGVMVPAFNPDSFTYRVMLPKSVAKNNVPGVIARVQANSMAYVKIDSAKSIPDTTFVIVTSEDSAKTAIYSVIFEYPPLPYINVITTGGGNNSLAFANPAFIDSTETTTLIAVPANGYYFIKWTENENEIGTNDTIVLTNVTESHTFTAHFGIYTYDITASATIGGTVNIASQTVNHGSNALPLVAKPDKSYQFINWTENNVVISEKDTLILSNITSNHTIVANFVKKQYTITATASPSDGGTLTGIPSSAVDTGTVITLKALPSQGYNFAGWLKGETTISTNSNYSFTASENLALIASFVKKQYTISASVTPASSGGVVGAGKYDTASTVTLTAVPARGYKFVNWQENNNVISEVSTLSFVATQNRSLVATFVIKTYDITVNIIPENAGSITRPSNPIDSGKFVTFTAHASKGFRFINWTEDGKEISKDSVFMFTVKASRTIVANFEQLNSISQIKDNNLKLYPTPAKSYLMIESPFMIKSVYIFDITGKVVLTSYFNAQNACLDISKLETGMYNILIISENGRFNNKFNVLK